MPDISEAIKQHRFADARQRVLINLLYTAGQVKNGTNAALREEGLSWQQFNLLRILRGQAPAPASMRLLSERMLDRQSNASRIVDRLEGKGLVARGPCAEDGRQVRVRLTGEGSVVLTRASVLIEGYYKQLGGGLTDEEILALSDAIDEFRCPRVEGEVGGKR